MVGRMDLDGSTKISLEEHYFRVFADRDGDGYLLLFTLKNKCKS